MPFRIPSQPPCAPDSPKATTAESREQGEPPLWAPKRHPLPLA